MKLIENILASPLDLVWGFVGVVVIAALVVGCNRSPKS